MRIGEPFRWHPTSDVLPLGLAPDALSPLWWRGPIEGAGHVLLSVPDAAPLDATADLGSLLALAVHRRAVKDGWVSWPSSTPGQPPPDVVFAVAGALVLARGENGLAEHQIARSPDLGPRLDAMYAALAELPRGHLHLFTAPDQADVDPPLPPGWTATVHAVRYPAGLRMALDGLHPYGGTPTHSPEPPVGPQGPSVEVLALLGVGALAFLLGTLAAVGVWWVASGPDLAAQLDKVSPAHEIALRRAIGLDAVGQARVSQVANTGIPSTVNLGTEVVALGVSKPLLVAVTLDDHVHALSPTTGGTLWTVDLGDVGGVGVSLTPGYVLVWTDSPSPGAAPTSTTLQVLRASNGSEVRQEELPEALHDVSVARDGRVALIASGHLVLLTPETGARCDAEDSTVQHVAWVGSTLQTTGSDGVALQWSCEAGVLEPMPVGAASGPVGRAADSVAWLDDQLHLGRRAIPVDPRLDRLAVGPAHVAAWRSGGSELVLLGSDGHVTVTAEGPLASIEFAGELLATATHSGVVEVWHPDSGVRTARLIGHQGTVSGMGVLGDHLYTSGRDGRVTRWWNALRSQLRAAERSGLSSNATLARAWDGSAWIRVEGSGAEVVIVERPALRPVPGSSLHHGSVSLGGDRIGLVGRQPQVLQWDGERYASRKLDLGQATHLAVGPAGHIATAGADGIHVTGIDGRTTRIPAKSLDWADRLELGPVTVFAHIGSESWAWTSSDGTLQAHAALPPPLRARSFGWFPAGYLAVAGDSSTAVLGAIDEERYLAGHSGTVRDITEVAEGMFATASQDGTVRLWSADSGAARGILDGGQPLEAVAAWPDGRWIAAGGSGRRVTVWETATRQAHAQLEVGARVQAMEVGPDGTLLVLTEDGRLQWFTVDPTPVIDAWAAGTNARVCDDGRVIEVVPFPGPDPWAPLEACGP
ncbi:MAG: WD40 repeat protein [Myxococcota bacterium]